MATLLSIINYIQEAYPNGVNSTTIGYLMNNNIRKVWRKATSTEIYEFQTVSSQALYSLPTDCEFDMISENGVLVSDSTEAVTSTHEFSAYSYAGDDEELIGNRYYWGVGNTLGIYPTPEDAGYWVRLKFQERPNLFSSTSDSTSVFNFKNDDYLEVIRNMTLSDVAKVGNYPDVEMANNYYMDALESQRTIKKYHAHERQKNPRIRWSYKEGW